MNRENQIMEIRIDEIIPNRFQPRLAFNETELKELSESIKMHGIIQPLVLRRIGDKYEIIAGERRYKASVLAGLTTVPAIIMNIDDKQSAEVAVVENLQRKNLTAIEEAQSYKKILDMGYLTQEELAGRMGVTQPTIANKLRLLNLEKEVQDALLRNQISERHARSLLGIPDRSIQVNMLNRIIKERLTVRQTDDEINKILGRSVNLESVEAPAPIVHPTTKEMPVSNILPEKENNIPHENRSIDMLLRKEPIVPTEEDSNATSSITLEPMVENKVDNLESRETIKRPMAINPFQEANTEVMNFEVPSQTFEKPKMQTPVEEINKPGSSLIEEFRKQNNIVPPVSPNPTEETTGPGISKAINVARDEARKIEQLGFNVDTEEFDFEDMYQIIIKIKK